MSKTLSDAELDDGLKEAKTKPRYYAIITKGQTIVKMIVQKKRILEGDILSARSEFGGSASITGVCTRNGMDLILQVAEKEPALQPIKIKQFITEQTGAALKPQWQVVTEFVLVPDSQTDGYSEPIVARQPKQDVPPAQTDSKKEVPYDALPTQQKKQQAQSSEQKPQSSETDGGYASYPGTAQSNPNEGQARVANQEQAQDQQAPVRPSAQETKRKKVLEALKKAGPKIQLALKHRDPNDKEPLANPAPEGTQSSSAPPYKVQVLELVAKVKELANDNDRDRTDEAMSVFRELVALLQTALADRGEVSKAKRTDRTVFLQQARLDWDSARKSLHAQLQDVAAAVQKECQNPNDYDPSDVKDGCKKLDIIMEKLDDQLIGVLDQALNAKEPSVRGGLEQQAVEVINKYLKTVNTDPTIKAVDESGLIAVPIQKSMSKLLGEMAGRLSA